jgi:nitrogen permease regulator 3-like protein
LNLFNVVFALPSNLEVLDNIQQQPGSNDKNNGKGNNNHGSNASNNNNNSNRSKSTSSSTYSSTSRKRDHLIGYRIAAATLANALFYEESRCNYVSTEALKIMDVWEQLTRKNDTGNTTSNSNSNSQNVEGIINKDLNGIVDNKGSTTGDSQTLIDVCLSRSLLACELKDIYHKLNENGWAHFSLNRWMPLSIALRDPSMYPSTPIRPYHTLLLLEDESSVLSSLPSDASPQLALLLEKCNAMKSFQNLHDESGISLTHIFRMSAHLVYWGKGKIIDTLAKNNVYAIHPNADLSPHSTFALEFQHRFSPMTIHETLHQLSSRLTNIGEHLRGMNSERQVQFLHILTWLLRRDFLMQIHIYIYLVLGDTQLLPGQSMRHHRSKARGQSNTMSRNNRRGNTKKFNMQELNPINGIQQSPPIGPGALHLQQYERAYLDQIANNTPVFNLFKRLCPYFHGKHHIEEIMWREKVSRKAIFSVLANYGDVLVTVKQPENNYHHHFI